MPPVGPNTRFLLAQPFLGETARALEDRGATAARRAVPVRRGGHDQLAARRRDARSASTRCTSAASIAPGRERAKRAIAHSARAAGGQAHHLPARFAARSAAGALPRDRTRHDAGRGRHALSPPPPSRAGTGAAARRHADQRRAGRRQAARPRPRRAARPDRLRPRPRQSAGGRGADDQMGDRAGLLADPRLRPGRRPRRTLRAAAAAARRAAVGPGGGACS